MTSTNKEKCGKNRALLIAVIVVVVAVVLYLSFWVFNYMKYDHWVKMTGYDEQYQGYIYCENDYFYSCHYPDFLEFDGNFSIAHTIRQEEQEDVQFQVFIWPKLDGSYEIGVTIILVQWNEEKKRFENVGYQYMLDENMELDLQGDTNLSDGEKKAVDGFESNRKEFDGLLERAELLWDIEL